MLVGQTAEGALKEWRADKLFIMVNWISLNFGLSHHTISEVTMKHGDDALPLSTRFDISEMGIQITLA
jgi:hypothetical protein